MGRDFLFPDAISPSPMLSFIVSQLFTPRDHV